jgi:hypothetical protein
VDVHWHAGWQYAARNVSFCAMLQMTGKILKPWMLMTMLRNGSAAQMIDRIEFRRCIGVQCYNQSSAGTEHPKKIYHIVRRLISLSFLLYFSQLYYVSPSALP